MSIPRAVIDQILDRIDLVELIHGHVPLKKAGKNFTACCPFHQEKSPSFSVSRETSKYHCFGCHAGGNAISFLMEYERRDFMDVLKDLAQRARVELPERDPQAIREAKMRTSYTRQIPVTTNNAVQQADASEQPQNSPSTEAPPVDFSGIEEDVYFHRDDDGYDYGSNVDYQPLALDNQEGNLYDLVEQIAQFYEQQLTQNAAARDYFNRRGLDETTRHFWRLGYAPDHSGHLLQRFPQELEGLKKLGLIRTSEQGRDYVLLRDRVIFPIRDIKGRVVGFGGRAMRDDVKPKYINSP
jgi:DNA primase